MKVAYKYILFVSVFVALAGILLPQTTHAAYKDDNLIDDYIYRNSKTMDANGIQVFLNSKGGALANYTDPVVNKSAAKIIFDSAQAYDINPQVILATLQKEQSLVTDPSPDVSQYKFAMGYGCPDSTGCSSYPGFNAQVDAATWQLRLNVELNSGRSWSNNSPSNYACGSATRYYSTGLYPGRTVTFYNEYGTAYKTITLANAATASFYCYTPHVYPGSAEYYYSGSYNFVTSFESWFGPSTGEGYVLATSAANNGDLRQWVVYRGERRLVADTDMVKAWGLDKVALVQMTGLYLGSIPQKADLTRLMRPSGTLDVYFVDGGKSYKVRSADMLKAWNFNPASILDVSVGLGQVPTNSGLLTYSIKGSAADTIYVVDGGVKRRYATPDIQLAWEGSTAAHTVISDTYLLAMALATDITNKKAIYGNKYYLLNESKAFLTVDSNIADVWGITGAMRLNQDISPEFVPHYMLTRVARSNVPGDSRQFIVDNGVLYHLSPEWAGNFNYNPAELTDVNPVAASSAAITTWNQGVLKSSTNSYYVIDNGTKRLLPPGTIANFWVDSNSLVKNVSNGFLNLYPLGVNMERAIKGSSTSVYAAQSGNKRWVRTTNAYTTMYAPFTVVSDKLINALPAGTEIN